MVTAFIYLRTMLTCCQVYPVVQRTVWVEFSKLTPLALDIAVEELIRVAIESGTGSRRCELAADTLIALSTIHTRAKVLGKLRTVRH